MKYWVFKCSETVYRLMEEKHEFVGSGNFCGYYTSAYINGLMYAEIDTSTNDISKYTQGKQIEFNTNYAHPVDFIKSNNFEEAFNWFTENFCK